MNERLEWAEPHFNERKSNNLGRKPKLLRLGCDKLVLELWKWAINKSVDYHREVENVMYSSAQGFLSFQKDC